MRYLNRIIFINSARIRYAEVSLNGNVHFIGTQGVGKSTLLRAILFFYNADTMGLGIPKSKASYTDYYFKDSNAYIIYEVVRDTGKFCIVSYKSQHKVCFRFFDGEYHRKYFVSYSGSVPDSWDGIAGELDKNKVFYTKRKIEEHKEYRDILYGNHDGKKNDLKRYCILESRDYQYIPKTIQNVFLNSKMEAEFIKQTIIMSLDNDFRIDLNHYTHHLSGFDAQLQDIRKFKTPGATAQAETISKLYIAIKNLEREKIQIVRQLAWAVNRNEHEWPDLSKRLEKQKEHESILFQKLRKIAAAFDVKSSKIKGDIRLQEENLRTVKRLTEEYQQKNISQIISRVEKRLSLEGEKKKMLSEKELLTTQFKEITQKFKALLDQLDNQFKEYVNAKEAEKNQLKSDFIRFESDLRKSYDKQSSDLRVEHKKEIEQAREIWEHTKRDTKRLEIEREEIKHKRFFEDELVKLDSEIRAFEDNVKDLVSQNGNLSREIESIQKNWVLDESELMKNLERDREKVEAQIAEATNNISVIESYITGSQDSLYGWLTDQYPGWEHSIGKVIDEKTVLFNSSLNPKLTPKTDNFYGVEINLDAINKTVKTVADYEKEKDDLTETVIGLRKKVSQLVEKCEGDKDNLKRKYQPKIREKKDQIKENEYSIDKYRAKRNENVISRNGFIENARNEKEHHLRKYELLIGESTQAELEAKDEVARLDAELEKLIKARDLEREKRVKAEDERVKMLLTDISAEITNERQHHKTRTEVIESQRKEEYSSKGADTKRLSEIDGKLTEINRELDFIEENRELVSDYRKDKREFLDRVEDFKSQKLKSERLLEKEDKKHRLQKENIDKELNVVLALIKSLEKTLDLLEEDNQAFNNFKDLALFKAIQDHFVGWSDENKTDKRVKVLIDGLNDLENQTLRTKKDELRRTVTEYLGRFNDDNIFKFKKQLTDDRSFIEFALMLSDFVEERKIDRIEKEVNERFAFIVSTIATQTNNLVSNSGEIQKIIGKVNDDFEHKNFAGVIKKIELKIDESKNEIVQLLVMIKRYNDENAMDLGVTNLFSGESQERKNREAVDLLKQFLKKIIELKKDFVSLSDSFELKFRIVENDNDSGWVEKLSNVGSEGTDVLVKAMLNIMLLNVFKEGASRKFKDFQLHCMMDEIGKLHPSNVRGILQFARNRNIHLISGSPIENDALAFDHIYKLNKDEKSITRVKRILTQYSDQ